VCTIFILSWEIRHLDSTKMSIKTFSPGTTRIIHMAAGARFDLPLQEARISTWVAQKYPEARRKCSRSRLTQIIHSHEHGIHCRHEEGTVLEDDFDAGQAFRTATEKSKFEAEALVRKRMKSIPVTIVRPKHHRWRFQYGNNHQLQDNLLAAPHICEKALAHCARFPDAILDIVPVNFVAEAVSHFSFDARARDSAFISVPGQGAT